MNTIHRESHEEIPVETPNSAGTPKGVPRTPRQISKKFPEGISNELPQKCEKILTDNFLEKLSEKF